MIPHMIWWQRVIAWMLWKLEAKHGFAGGFSDPMEGAGWIFEGNGNPNLLYSVGLLRNYYYIRKYEEWERTHG